MKPQLTLLALFFFLSSLTAQVKFKVKLLPDNQTYQVLFKPETNWSNPASTTLNSAQVSLRVPAGNFTVGTITNQKGTWALQSQVNAPVEAPNYKYLNFGLETIIPGSQITYTQGVEIPMFSFVNTGGCVGPVSLVDLATDPFSPPNSISFNIGSTLSTVGAGNGVEAYIGDYSSFPADCTPAANNCGIEVFDVALLSPSACGVADGSISIVATTNIGLPLQYSITYGTAQTVWQSSPVFTNLAAGDTYYVAVRDIAGICLYEAGEFELDGPLAAIIQGVTLNDPTCGGTNGSIILQAVSANGGTIEFGMSQNGPWQSSSTFNNLAEGTYTFWVRDITNNCQNIIGTYTLDGCVGPDCILTYDLQYLGNARYEVNLITDTTWTGINATTSLQITLKVPTGGFEVSNLTGQIFDTNNNTLVDFQQSPPVVAPAEDPTSDFLSFTIVGGSTSAIPYIDGNTVHLFTFENSGNCVGDSVRIMMNDDPVTTNPNSNLAQQIFVIGYGGDVPVCIGNAAAICEVVQSPCTNLVANFSAADGCEGTSISFSNTSTSTETITSWSWNFGDGSAVATSQNPSHTYSSSGNFEVSLTVTTQSGCSATFMDFVTVFPSPGDAPVSSYTICDGLGVTIETPDNITSAVWSPTTGLTLTDPFNPIANPAATTTYTLTATNSFGCVNTSQVQVIVVNKPVLGNVATTPITDCNKSDASITITATGIGAIQYGIDSGSGITWQTGNMFSNLAAGTYSVYVRNADGSCPAAYNGNPIVFAAPVSPTINSVSQVQPVGCNDNGSITINATGGQAPLQYSITGNPPFQASNVFNNLGGGTYNIVVRNADGTCATLAGPIVYTETAPPTIDTPIADQTLCVGATANISIQLSGSVASYTINGNSNYPGASINGSKLNFTVTATLGATNYTAVLIRPNGCSATETFAITGVVAPTASFSVSPTVCTNGNTVLNFTGTASPNAIITWALAGAQVVDASLANGNTPANATMVLRWTSAGAKSVTLTVNNGGCSVSSVQTINVAAFNPGATFATTDATCGLANGAINMSVTGSGLSYSWSNGSTAQDLSSLAGGQYFVTISETASGCQSSASATVTTSPALNISNVSTMPAAVCTGGNGDGTITVQVSGGTAGTTGYTYSLSGQLPINTTQTTVTFNNLASAPYTVTVTDSKGCTDVETVTVLSQTSQVTASITVVNAACTQNNGSLTATANGGVAPYTYSLIKNNAIVSSNQPVTGNTVTLNTLEPANYTIVFLDANGCIAAGSGNVVRSQGVFAATTTTVPASCGSNNGSIALAGVPAGATIAWSSGGNANPNINLAAGVYTVTLTETNGCTASSSIIVNTAGGQDVNVALGAPASCGLPNGTISFTVTGGGSFSYIVLGANLSPGFGTPGTPVAVSGFDQGAYVLEVTDNLQQTCKVYEPFVVTGSASLQTTTTVQQVSGCGLSDGEVTVIVSGGTAPFTVTSSMGTVQQGTPANEFHIINLTEGIVTIEITDNLQCSATVTGNMGNFVEPVIAPTDFTITAPNCPDGLGSIVSTSSKQYQIINAANGMLVAGTPWTSAPKGEYRLVLVVDGCSDTLNVSVGGPANWGITATIEADSCVSPGSVSLAVSGGTATYTIAWSNGASGTTISNLPFGTYTATITDSNNCTTTSSNIVEDDCSEPFPCDEDAIFYTDTFIVQLTAALTEICLPTTLTNLEDFELVLNDEEYARTIGDCGATTHFYNGLDMLPVGGPYVLESWEYDGPGSPLTNFQFQDINDLLDKLKELDNLANWIYTAGNISGGRPDATYGDMSIKHLQSGIITEFPVGKQIIPHPTVLVDNNRAVQVLIATDPVSGCVDTLYLNLLQPAQPASDSILVEVEVGETVEVCIPVDELIGNIESLENECISFTNNAQLIMSGDTCIQVEGLEAGPDQACIVVCDDLGVCDTTYLVINVIEGNTEIQVMTGFSPNGDGVNDLFKVRNIELYPDNTMLILNRWGKTVLEDKRYRSNWNGEYRGSRLPDGSYFYVLRVKIDGKERVYKGFVELRR